MPVISLRADVCIPKNTRIGQFIILPKIPRLNFETIDDLGNENRNGFGSTGTI